MIRALLFVAVLAAAARADDFEDLGNCREEAFGATDKTPSRTIVIERDTKHRIAKQTTKLAAGGAALVQTRDYDDKGRLATVHIDELRVVNEYDAKTGRLGRTLELDGKSTTPTRVWAREYDAAGHLVREVAHEGDKETIDKAFTYDKAGRVAKIAMDHGATTEAHTYDDKGRLVRNDVVISQKPYAFTYRYDDKGRRIEQASATGRIVYTYECH